MKYELKIVKQPKVKIGISIDQKSIHPKVNKMITEVQQTTNLKAEKLSSFNFIKTKNIRSKQMPNKSFWWKFFGIIYLLGCWISASVIYNTIFLPEIIASSAIIGSVALFWALDKNNEVNERRQNIKLSN